MSGCRNRYKLTSKYSSPWHKNKGMREWYVDNKIKRNLSNETLDSNLLNKYTSKVVCKLDSVIRKRGTKIQKIKGEIKIAESKEVKELNNQRVLRILTEPVKFRFPKQTQLESKPLINNHSISTKNVRKAMNKTSSSGSRDMVDVSHSEIVSKKRTAVINLAVLGGSTGSVVQNASDR